METIEDQLAYVDNLVLKAPNAAFPASKGEAMEMAEGIEQSFLNAKSLVSFVADVNSQRRQDVLNSVLLAQLAANKQFPDEEQVLDWYKTFTNVLNNIGWAIDATEFSSFESSTDLFEVQNAIIEILTTAFGGVFKELITKTLSTIKSLGDSNGKITAFEKNTHSLSKGAFQIGLAKEENDTISLQLATFLLTSSTGINKILFFKSAKSTTRFDYSFRKGTLNGDVYDKVRQPVLDKLGKKATDFITEIEI